MIHMVNEATKNSLCNTYFFHKKKLFAQYTLHIHDIHKYTNFIQQSMMVVFHTEINHKQELINSLTELCVINKYYGPIVDTGANDIYFFPKLKYEDVYLIKDMFENKFINQKVRVIFGKSAIT